MNRLIILVLLLGDAIKRYRRVILRLALGILVALVVGTSLFYVIEGPRHAGVGFFQTFWSVFFTMISGDFVEVKPATAAGRILVTLLIFFGIGVVSVVTATIASGLVIDKIKEGKGMRSLRLRRHTVICGWNDGAPVLIAELRAAAPRKDVVVVAELEENQLADADARVHFVCGDCTEEPVLARADAAYAADAVVLADRSGGRGRDADADARTILTVMTLKALNPALYVCAELVHDKNRPHLERVRADEVVVSGEYGGKVLATAALQHGLSRVVDDLLSADAGAEFYRVPVPAAARGADFDAASLYLRRNHRAIPVAVFRGGEAIVDPEVGFKLAEGDELAVIALEPPKVK